MAARQNDWRARTYGIARRRAPAMRLAGLLAILAFAIATGPAQAKTMHLVAFGDSLSAGYMLPQADAFPTVLEKALRDEGRDVTVANAAVSGDTTNDGLARLDWSIPDDTDGVLLELGANDMLRGLDPDLVRKNLAAMLDRLKQRHIPVLLIGMRATPSLGRDYVTKFEAIYPDLAKAYDVPLYPFFLDGVAAEPSLSLQDGMHPNPRGVRKVVDAILPTVRRFLDATSGL